MVRIPAAAVSALRAGNKVEAVKITRQAEQVSLKEALDAVDDYLVENSEVKDVFLQMRKNANRTVSIILKISVGLLLLGMLLAYFGY
jgi:ribosomal protein L7/L12